MSEEFNYEKFNREMDKLRALEAEKLRKEPLRRRWLLRRRPQLRIGNKL